MARCAVRKPIDNIFAKKITNRWVLSFNQSVIVVVRAQAELTGNIKGPHIPPRDSYARLKCRSVPLLPRGLARTENLSSTDLLIRRFSG